MKSKSNNLKGMNGSELVKKLSDLREEIDIQINMIAEREITKIIHLVSYLMKHLNVPYDKDPELKRMMKPLDMEEMRRELEQQLNLSSKK